eukprot:2460155-Pleurochrysis_carterae.AAC.5
MQLVACVHAHVLHRSKQMSISINARVSSLQMMLYRPWEAGVLAGAASDELGEGVCVWGDAALRTLFPRLAVSIDTHQGMASTPEANHRRYFWFHASLMVWNASFGHAYPNVKYWWRIEPDVLFSGSWAALLRHTLAHPRSGSDDVLLPRLTTYMQDPKSYPHWQYNMDILKNIPKERWVYSLVSVGRYSTRFLHHMTELWAAGILGYEEIFLPMACIALSQPACKLGSFQKLRSAGWRTTQVANYFRFRPNWHCSEFLPAGIAHTQELWHPVKHRECWVNYLDSCTADGCNASLALDVTPPLLGREKRPNQTPRKKG